MHSKSCTHMIKKTCSSSSRPCCTAATPTPPTARRAPASRRACRRRTGSSGPGAVPLIGKTFQMNVASTPLYNADFDGYQMSIWPMGNSDAEAGSNLHGLLRLPGVIPGTNNM